MKKIIIHILHPMLLNKKTGEEKLAYFKRLLGVDRKELGYEFVWGEESCDYLFVSEHIQYGLCNKVMKKKFNKITKNCNPVLIFLAGECVAPDFNIFDYAIVFDKDLRFKDRCIHMPTSLRFHNSIIMKENPIKSKEEALQELHKKKYFCNFIYSNSDAHPKRDELFEKIASYKKVFSLGKHLHNFTFPENEITNKNDWRLESIEMKSKFKFSIACENSRYEGYTSEKIITSFEANTIPIYWGNPLITEEFNEEAFINCNNFSSDRELIAFIEKIDKNDDIWCEMIAKPWKTQEQILREQREEKEYLDFLNNIFSQDFLGAKRVGTGCTPNYYRHTFRSVYYKESFIEKIKKKIQSIIK